MMPARLLQLREVLEMDIQDFKVTSDKNNRYLLCFVVVDRSSKFLSAFPLPSKKAICVSRKQLELLLTHGLPLSIRCDPGNEFTAAVMQHLCRWLKVPLDYGLTNHPRAQGPVERLRGWLHEALSYLCTAWPKRLDDFVATWIHRATPDPALPGGASPYTILFGREPRSQIDIVTQTLEDDNSFGQGLERTVADQQRMTREILAYRHQAQSRQRERHNARVLPQAAGAKAAVGDLVLVKEPTNIRSWGTATSPARGRSPPSFTTASAWRSSSTAGELGKDG
eukprot:g9614.t1